MNKAELLNLMREGRANLDSILSRLSDDQMLLGELDNGWSVKDLIGHFGWWENRAGYLFGQVQKGEPIIPISDEIDALNAKVYAENKARSLAEIRQFEQTAYTNLRTMVEHAADNDLFDPHRAAWTQGQPFMNWIEGNTYGHYAEHMDPLVKWATRIGALK